MEHPSSPSDGANAPMLTDEGFKMFLDAKTHHQTSSFLDPNTEQSLYLKVEDWFKDEPAFYWMIDEKPSSSSFVGLSIPRDQTLEFQFKVPAGFADRASIPIHIRTLLSDQRRLGITTIYYGAETVRKCLDILMKASSDRPNWSPNWSEPVLMYGAEFTWMKRSPESPAVYFKAIADENEICVLAVKEESPAYKAEFESDPHKFIQGIALPLRIKFQVELLKARIDRFTSGIPGASPEDTTKGQEWWASLLRAQQHKEDKGKAKSSEWETKLCMELRRGSATTSAQEETAFTQHNLPSSSLSSCLPQPPSSSSYLPSSPPRPPTSSKQKNKKREKTQSSSDQPLHSEPPPSQYFPPQTSSPISQAEVIPSDTSFPPHHQLPSSHLPVSQDTEGKHSEYPLNHPVPPKHPSSQTQGPVDTSHPHPHLPSSRHMADTSTSINPPVSLNPPTSFTHLLSQQTRDTANTSPPKSHFASSRDIGDTSSASTTNPPVSRERQKCLSSQQTQGLAATSHPQPQLALPRSIGDTSSSSTLNPPVSREYRKYLSSPQMQDMMATSHPSLAGIGSGQERSGDKLLAESQVSAHTSVTTEPRKKLSKRERKKARQAAAKAAQLAATQGQSTLKQEHTAQLDTETSRQDQITRSAAIDLIRARTLTRTPTGSPTESAPVHRMNESSQKGSVSDATQPAMPSSKKKAKHRPKNSNGKGRGAETAPTDSSSRSDGSLVHAASIEPHTDTLIRTAGHPSSPQSRELGRVPDSGEDLQELHLGSLRFKAPARLVPSSTPVAGGAVVEPGRGLLGLGQKSSSSVDAKEQPTVHHGHPSPALHHQPFGAGGGTEDRRAGKMDHYLLGDPSVGPSDAKGKGRVESDEEAVRKPSKGLDPSSKLFVPEGAHVVAPSATRRAGGPVPEDPVQVPAPVVQSGRSSRPLPPIPEVGRPPAATATITGVRPTPGSSMAAQTRSTDLAAPRLTPGSNLTAEPVHSVSNNPSRGPGGAAAPSSSNNNHAHSSGASSCEVECALEGCEARCRLWDEAAIICPRCGPHVEVRYCVQGHLHEDVKMHWVWCGQMAVARPCREDLIPSRLAREAVPMVPCLHGWDSPERHRQAVRFADGGLAGDYFVFADWADLGAAGYPSDRLLLRCSFRVVETVRFDDPEERDRFRRVLAVCLFSSVENVGLVDFLFRLIRDALRSRGAWSPDTDMAVRYQFQSELSVTIRTEITGERHACVGDWEGLNPRHCRDPVCRSERRYFLGDPGRGRGYRRLVEHMEASYWVLRAARTTHPRVTETVARMRGEGFSDVVEEEKREFRRGPGWDGAGAGDMEIEGINA